MVHRRVMKCILVAMTIVLAISLGHNPGASEPANRVTHDLSRIPQIFADESAYLGNLGGYSDPGANATSREAHLAWAQHQTAPVIVENLVKKYCNG